MFFPILLLGFALLAFFEPASAAEFPLSPLRDNTLFQDAEGDTSNGSGSGIFCGRNSQGRIRRAVIAFDVGQIPQGALLDSVRIELHMASSSDLAPRVLNLHRLLADWGEGASASAGGGGAPAQPGDATWLHTFYPDEFWPTAGGHFRVTPSATITVLGEGDYALTSEMLTNDVRSWVTQEVANFGWILLGDESVSNTARRFDSRESESVSFRPRLVVYYSVPTPTISRTWGWLKHGYRLPGG